MFSFISKILASRLLSVVLMAALAGVGWYVLDTIKRNERLSIALDQANANVKEANRRAKAELARAKHLSKLNQEIRDDEKPSDCADPAIINRAIERLQQRVGQEN